MTNPSTSPALFVFNLLIFIFVIVGIFLQIFSVEMGGAVWTVVVVLFLLMNARRLRFAGIIMSALAVTAIGIEWYTKGPSALDGVVRASFFFSLLLLFQTLGRIADLTREVGEIGEVIVSRPPGQRYLFTTFGSHILSVPLNLGGLIVINTLLRSRAKNLDDDTNRALVVGSLRGFASTTFWSPFSLGVLIVLSSVGDVDYLHFAPIGFVMAIAYMLFGFRFERRGIAAAVRGADYPPPNRKMIVGAVLGVALLSIGIAAVSRATHLQLIQVVFLVLVAGCIIMSLVLARRGLMTVSSAIKMMSGSASNVANETAIIWGSTALGAVVAGALANAHWLESGFGPLQAGIAAAIVPSLIVLGAAIAINPLVSAAILAGSLSVVWPEGDKIWLVFAIIWGWVATTCGTPFTANMLLIAQQQGITSTQLAYGWNGRFTLLSLAILTVMVTVGTIIATL
ncbi:MAG: hypothetical protein H6883_10720 [Rhodobiaceae bacterium]|nr:hypothetical protein [Rhodobiaceae bacterium]MCC0056602.1 hypothetical protein [Rhodobiaceae bacterium]